MTSRKTIEAGITGPRARNPEIERVLDNNLPYLKLPDPGEIHLWHWGLDGAPSVLEACRRVLNNEERQRADRFFREIHRNRFTVGRGYLRGLLASYLNADPAALEFTYNAQGKPSVDFGRQGGTYAFNLSHSGDQALLAIAGFFTVGVDIEACSASRDLLLIARRFFSAAEQAELLALPPEQHQAAFYRCWSGKEALLKAWGTGLSTPLDQFSVRVAPGEVGVRAIDLPEWSDYPWTLYAVTVPEGYVATVAVPGVATRINARTWPADRP